MFDFKLTSSLEKAFLDQTVDQFKSLEYISGLRGERISLQLLGVIKGEYAKQGKIIMLDVRFSGKLAEYCKIRNVRHMGVSKPANFSMEDPDYLRTTPGLYPDLLENSNFGGKFILCGNNLQSFWIDIEIPDSIDVTGISDLTLNISSEDIGKTEKFPDVQLSCKIEVINATLPEQTLTVTNWFYCDTLAEYYEVPVFSERHWEIIENFAATAVKHGQNVLLTPILTPSLDTRVGGERLTTQLIGISKTDGKYSFDFSLVDRWVQMCDRIGVKYFEISHLFTQWGAAHAPKVVATVDGEEKKIFGWETDAHSEEYGDFLRQMLRELISHLKESGNDKRCLFHISDEPRLIHLESYKKSKAQVAEILSDYTVIDALSHVEFYKMGIMDNPVPFTKYAKEFIDAGIKDMWVYYCGVSGIGCSSRMLAMPGARNRSLGMQLYKYNVAGFLHWGYNFYHNCQSYGQINPFVDQSGGEWVAAGDMYLVYPGKNGMPMESTRLLVFEEGLNDMRAMQLCESLYSHDEVVAAIEDVAGREITFTNTICDSETVIGIRKKINDMIKARI